MRGGNTTYFPFVSMRRISFYFLALTVLFVSCKRTISEGVLGPEKKAASPNFKVLDTLKANYFNGLDSIKLSSSIKKGSDKGKVAFQKTVYHIGTVYNKETGLIKDTLIGKKQSGFHTFFRANFNEVVSWKLKLYPLDNSKFKTFSGTTSKLDSTNTLWDGSTDGSAIFAKGDVVVAELSFLEGTSLKLYDTIKVATEIFYPASQALLLNDFEGDYGNTFTYNDQLDSKPSPLPDVDKNEEGDKSRIAPQGKKSMRIYGTDNNGDYFVGGMNIQKFNTDVIKNYAPKDIYFNVFVYGYHPENSLGINTKATKLNIGVSEDDAVQNGEFNPLNEDTFEKQINVEWSGWKLISIRYADLVKSNSVANGGSGNGILQPDRAFSFNCNLIASPNGSTVGANIDYVIITYGKPFELGDL